MALQNLLGQCSWAFALEASAVVRRAMADGRCDPGWYGARRWRVEITMILKWIAAEFHIGSWTDIANFPGQKECNSVISD